MNIFKITPHLDPTRRANDVTRLDNVDLLKGLAIFLMVMGHFLVWQWGGPIVSQKPADLIYVDIVKKFIYSFHMPLFFFLSGYVFNMRLKNWTLKEYGQQILKRTRQLLIPGLVCMFICRYNEGVWYFEWFIKVMYEIFFINATIFLIGQRFKHNLLVESVLQVATYTMLYAISKFVTTSFVTETIAVPQLINGMSYYYIGTLFFRYNIMIYISKHNSIIGAALIVWVITFFMHTHNVHIPDRGIFTAMSAIIVCMSVAQGIDYSAKHNVVEWFVYIGKYTLPIYLLSPYFIPRGFLLGEIIETFSTNDIQTAIAVQLTMGVFFSTYVCLLVLGLAKVFEKSFLLKILFLGK